MDKRICKRCGKAAVHKQRRADWEKARDNLIGMRRNLCVRCGAARWVPLPGRQGPAWGTIIAVGAVGIGAFALILSRTGSTNDGHPVAHRQAAVAPQTAEAAQADSGMDVVAAMPSSSVPTEAGLQRTSSLGQALPGRLATTEAKLSPQAEGPQAATESTALIPRELRAVTPRWTGERMEVLIEADALPADYTLIYVASSGGYVLDIPGVWTIRPGLRRSRSFTRSNLSALDVGLHESFLRIVLRTADKEPKPDIGEDARALRILL